MLNALDTHAAPFMQETERERLTHELYDNAVQTLVALVTDMECFRTHRHFASATLQETTYATLLALCGYIGRSGDDPCEISAAAGTVWRSHRCHSHTHWAV